MLLYTLYRAITLPFCFWIRVCQVGIQQQQQRKNEQAFEKLCTWKNQDFLASAIWSMYYKSDYSTALKRSESLPVFKTWCCTILGCPDPVTESVLTREEAQLQPTLPFSPYKSIFIVAHQSACSFSGTNDFWNKAYRVCIKLIFVLLFQGKPNLLKKLDSPQNSLGSCLDWCIYLGG